MDAPLLQTAVEVKKRNSGVSIILITFGIEGFSSSSLFSPNLTFGLIEHDPLLRFWRERPPAARFSVSTSQPSSSLAYSRFINQEIKIIITWSIPIPSTSINLHHSSGCCDCFWVNWGLPDHQQIFSRTICASNVNHEDGSCSQALDQSKTINDKNISNTNYTSLWQRQQGFFSKSFEQHFKMIAIDKVPSKSQKWAKMVDIENT